MGIVLAFHLALLRIGWMGVSLFFVISGFLITGILLDTKDRPHYFRRFYIRRTLRIFPIYYLSLAAVLLLWPEQPHADIAYYFSYVQNYLLAANHWQVSAPVFIGHTWSLAVEEQFYLLWPALVLMLNRRTLAWTCAALFLASAALRLIWSATNPETFAPYMSLPTNMDALCSGALLSILWRHNPGFFTKHAMHLLLAGLAVLGGTVAYLHLNFLYHWQPAELATRVPLLSPVCSAMFVLLIASAVGKAKYFAAFLRLPPLMYIGKISYGLYLYHFIIMQGTFGFRHPFLYLAILLTVSMASWHFIETPLLKLKDRYAP
ncbi:MAG: acyltransferase [Elusimicrobia bacterium]|nr:acyltransferase [Elusimicrobiota bacterium]